MTSDPQQALIEPLMAELSGTFSVQELRVVFKAYGLAAACHQGQLRKSGDPSITHSVAVAEAAASAHLGYAMVCAALLHNVLEDTDCEPELLRAEFGEEIAHLVEDLTAFSWGRDESGNAPFITLKLLDRLHNMRTIQHVDMDKQVRKSHETLDLLVPHAQRLGLPLIAAELQDLARHRLQVLIAETAEIRAPLGALRLGSFVLPLAFRIRYLEEWAAELAALPDARGRRRFAQQLLLGLPRLSVMLRRADWRNRSLAAWRQVAASHLTRSGLRILRWVLCSETRTWTLLGPLVAWMVMQTAHASPGDAVITLITVPPVLGAGVKWLRTQLDISQRNHDTPD